ncbi:hypothetical protein GCM10022278_24730 [Allohahella marinimesophila]|uniref:GNAT family N-acetyltransferase n=1 Tax=Allohahella marinimesophila TaxID=1054972 RepID=A0ABP7PI58_9GAMM
MATLPDAGDCVWERTGFVDDLAAGLAGTRAAPLMPDFLMGFCSGGWPDFEA